MHGGRLVIARDHETGAGVRAEIVHHGGYPAPRVLVAFRAGRDGHAQSRGDRPGEPFDLARAAVEQMVGLGAGQRRCTLDDVKPVHIVRVVPFPAGGEIPGIPHRAGTVRQEVSVEGQDHVGLLEVVTGGDDFAEGQSRTFPGVVQGDRIVLVPTGAGVPGQQGFQLPVQARRSDGTCKYTYAAALFLHLVGQGFVQFVQVGVVSGDAAPPDHRLGPVRVVHRQDGGLGENVRRSQAGGMFRVALHLGGPAHVAFHQDTVRHPVVDVGRGVVQGLARDDLFRGQHVGDDLLGRLAGTGGGGGAGQCD